MEVARTQNDLPGTELATVRSTGFLSLAYETILLRVIMLKMSIMVLSLKSLQLGISIMSPNIFKKMRHEDKNYKKAACKIFLKNIYHKVYYFQSGTSIKWTRKS